MPVPASQTSVPPRVERPLDALGHDELRRPLAVRRMRAGERPVRRKQPLEHAAQSTFPARPHPPGGQRPVEHDELAGGRARGHAPVGLGDLVERIDRVDPGIDDAALDLLDDRPQQRPGRWRASLASSEW